MARLRLTRALLVKVALLGWSGAISTSACLRVVAAPSAKLPFIAAPEPVRRALFADFARAEPALREASRRAFPGDRWSADDDFHNHERGLVSELARTYAVSETAVWDALDDGLHGHWPGADTPGLLPRRASLPPSPHGLRASDVFTPAVRAPRA